MAKKKPTIIATPLVEEYIHEYHFIKVCVRIDYQAKQISLLEATGRTAKKWVFANREIKYMDGWHLILDAMKSAIDDAQEKLAKYLDIMAERELELHVELEKAKNK